MRSLPQHNHIDLIHTPIFCKKMGCNNSKREENIQETLRLLFRRKRNKVRPITEEKVGHFLGSYAENSVRKTQQTVLCQLNAEGIVPKKGNGGVAFVVNMSEPSPSSILPGAPEYGSQYTYSQALFPSGNLPSRRLPPLNKAAMGAKQQRARKNRERKRAEKKAKCTKQSYRK